MSTENTKLINNLAEKLGLDELTIQKGKEYIRGYQNKSDSLRLNIPENSKTIICLDLASKTTGSTFDRETGLKLSGLKSKTYSTHLNTIEKVLGLDKPLTVSELCVRLSCTELKETAESILDIYSESNKHAEVTHPQYVCVAVWSAAKLKSVKLAKSKIVASSRLKATQWKELEMKFDEFMANTNVGKTKEKSGKKKDNFMSYVEEYAKNKENEGGNVDEHGTIEEEEDYEVWKERILKEAYEKIAKKNNS